MSLDLDAIRARDAEWDKWYIVNPDAIAAYRDRRALLAEVDRLTAFYSSLVAEAFDNGAAAERARIRAAVEGLVGRDTLERLVDRAAVLAAIDGGGPHPGGIEQFQDEDR